ncbi:MAG: hypothetical protein SFW63_05715 [Alphaproteobacteria bacterium]|nr:hypothetical protein [Alphaproteobacteria bacterium]
MSKKTHSSTKPPVLNFTYEGDMLFDDPEYKAVYSEQMEILKGVHYRMAKEARSLDDLNTTLDDFNKTADAAFRLLHEMYTAKLKDSDRAGEEVQDWQDILKEASRRLWKQLDEQKRSGGSQGLG